MPLPSGTAQMPWRASFSDDVLPMGVPPTSTSPAVARNRPLSTLSSVDLPAPFGPSRAKMLPAGTSRSTPWSTSIRP